MKNNSYDKYMRVALKMYNIASFILALILISYFITYTLSPIILNVISPELSSILFPLYRLFSDLCIIIMLAPLIVHYPYWVEEIENKLKQK